MKKAKVKGVTHGQYYWNIKQTAKNGVSLSWENLGA